VQITAGLAAGLGLGLLASAGGWPWLRRLVDALEPVGTVWINLIRMVVIPLVVAALVSGVAGLGGVARLGRLGARTLAFFWGTTVLAIGLGLILALVAMPLAPLTAATAEALRSAAAAAAPAVAGRLPQTPGLGDFLVNLVPANPIKAAADGALLPVIVFSVLVGAGVASLDPPRRTLLSSFAEAVVAALTRLIGWFMVVAPLAVLCLAAPITARYGWGMLGSLALFVGTVAVGLVLFVVLVFGAAAAVLARVRPLPFAQAIAPASALGFTTTTSMAALPVMMDIAGRDLGISAPVSSFVLPLGATINRPATGLYHLVAAIFLATLYGVPLGAAKLALVGATTFLMTLSVPAVPSGNILALAPVLLAAGLPLEGIGLLLGVDRIPDMFRTGTNVTGHMVAAACVARGEGEEVMGAA
jgi:Na+/H+-dicarboxylate symporter